jgi:hypothetical protein
MTELHDPNSGSTTPAGAEIVFEPEVVARMRKMFDYIINDVRSNANTTGKMRFFITKLVDESLKDMGEVPPEVLQEQLARSAAAMYWVATGQVIENLPVPDGFWDSVGEMPASLSAAPTPLAIEGGTSVE